MYFIKTTQGFLLPDSTRCLSGLQRRAGQRLLVCYGWRGGGHPPVLLSSASLSCPPSVLSLSLSLSLSLAGLDLLSSAESPAEVETHLRMCEKSFLSSYGDTEVTFLTYLKLNCS